MPKRDDATKPSVIRLLPLHGTPSFLSELQYWFTSTMFTTRHVKVVLYTMQSITNFGCMELLNNFIQSLHSQWQSELSGYSSLVCARQAESKSRCASVKQALGEILKQGNDGLHIEKQLEEWRDFRETYGYKPETVQAAQCTYADDNLIIYTCFDTEDARLQTLSISTSFTVILDVDDLAANRIADSIHRGRHHGERNGKSKGHTYHRGGEDTVDGTGTIIRQSRHSQAEKKTNIMPHDETFLPLECTLHASLLKRDALMSLIFSYERDLQVVLDREIRMWFSRKPKKPLDAGLSRFAVSSAFQVDDGEEDIVHTGTVAERVVHIIHLYGLFSFKTGIGSAPVTPSTNARRDTRRSHHVQPLPLALPTRQ
ncbi:hypothetical protein BC629DRAFT_1437923 [Irpex lacteus]|nr:hypothetical protein BC629DRAFT_1437923 [Irpex lacteus]